MGSAPARARQGPRDGNGGLPVDRLIDRGDHHENDVERTSETVAWTGLHRKIGRFALLHVTHPSETDKLLSTTPPTVRKPEGGKKITTANADVLTAGTVLAEIRCQCER